MGTWNINPLNAEMGSDWTNFGLPWNSHQWHFIYVTEDIWVTLSYFMWLSPINGETDGWSDQKCVLVIKWALLTDVMNHDWLNWNPRFLMHTVKPAIQSIACFLKHYTCTCICQSEKLTVGYHIWLSTLFTLQICVHFPLTSALHYPNAVPLFNLKGLSDIGALNKPSLQQPLTHYTSTSLHKPRTCT